MYTWGMTLSEIDVDSLAMTDLHIAFFTAVLGGLWTHPESVNTLEENEGNLGRTAGIDLTGK